MGRRLFVFLVLLLLAFPFLVSSANPVRQATVEGLVVSELDENGEADVIVVLREPSGGLVLSEQKKSIDAQEKNVISALSEDELDVKNKFSSTSGFSGKIKKSALNKLRFNRNVEGVFLDKQRTIDLSGSVPLVNATLVWPLVYNSSNITGDGETVCIVDTGVNYSHPDMGGCSNATFLAGGCDKVLSGFDYVNDDNDPSDDHSHGTHVAGIVASNNSIYRGVAPGARIVALKACNSAGSCSDSDITASIDWCVSNYSRFNISVISMSLGGGSYSAHCDGSEPYFRNSVNSAVARNISVIASTGNDYSTSVIGAPACVANVTAVGSSTKADAISSFSNRNNITDLIAPGSSITSLDYQGTTRTMSGTSMAAPHVAGAFALLRQYYRVTQNRTLVPERIQDSLNFTGVSINDSAGNGVTYKRISLHGALVYLDPSPPNISITTPSNDSVVSASSVNVNISANKSVFAAFLEWNGTSNFTMSRLNSSFFYLSKSNVSNGNYTFRVFANNTWNVFGISAVWSVMMNNSAPYGNSSFNVSSAGKNDTSNIGSDINVSDPNGDSLSFSFRWFNQSGLVSGANTSNLSGSFWSKGSNLTVEVEVSDGSLSVVFNSSYLVISNSVPVGNASINISNVTGNTSFLGGVFNYSDSDSEAVSLSFRWFNQSGLVSGQNSSNLSNSFWAKGDNITFEVALNDSSSNNSFNSSSVRVYNSPPFIYAQNVFENSSVGRWFLVYANVTDNDGSFDIVNASILSTNSTCVYVRNTTNGAVFGVLFNCTNPSRAEAAVSIVFNDTNSSSISTVQTRNVFPNLLPIVNGSINVSSASKNMSSLGASFNASDPDGDPLSFSFRWFNQSGLVSGQNSSNLSNSFWAKGDNITFEAVVSDSFGNVSLNSSLVISNSNSFSNVDLTFENSSAGHWFLAYANVTDNDGSADILNVSINFTLGSCSYLRNTSSGLVFGVLFNCTYSNASLTNITVLFNDSSSFSLPLNGSNIYPNQAPSAIQVNISPSPANVTNDLSCIYGFSDSDSDSDGSEFRWFNGSGLMDAVNKTIFSGNLSSGSNLSCEVRPFDGIEYGARANSSSINIGDFSPPLLFNSTQSADSVLESTSITFRVNASDSLSGIRSGFLEIENPSGVKSNKSMTIVSLLNSVAVLEANYSPSSTGTWYVKFYALDNSGNIGNNTERNLSFIVTSPSTQSSSSSSSSGGGGGGGGGGSGALSSSVKSTSLFSPVSSSVPYSMKINNPSIPLDRISFSTRSAFASLTISAEVVNSSNLTPVRNAYQFIKINPSLAIDDSDFSSVRLVFGVNKSWFAVNGLDKDKVALNRLKAGIWQPLPTKLVNESLAEFVYSAESPGFSFFAINAQPLVTLLPNASVEEKPELPGSEPVVNNTLPVDAVQENKTSSELIPAVNQGISLDRVVVVVVLAVAAVFVAFVAFFLLRMKKFK